MHDHGFSLLEVLIALFIGTSAALGLLHQQWQAAIALRHMTSQAIHIRKIENAAEQRLMRSLSRPAISAA